MRIVQTHADRRMPAAQTAASSVASPAAARPLVAALQVEGATAAVRPDITAVVLATALT